MTSYGDDDGFIEWLAAQGLPSPAGDPAVLRQIGSNYIDAAYEARLNCSSRAGGFNQLLAWPRKNHKMNGQTVPSDLVPQAWINAAYRAAYLEDMTPGWATDQVTPGRITRREQVDVISREFFSPEDAGGGGSAAPGMPTDAIINGMVLPFLCSNTRGLNSLFRVV